jgi:hypothetical protein
MQARSDANIYSYISDNIIVVFISALRRVSPAPKPKAHVVRSVHSAASIRLFLFFFLFSPTHPSLSVTGVLYLSWTRSRQSLLQPQLAPR